MPTIDVTTPAGLFDAHQKRELVTRSTAALLRWERAPDLDLFRDNTAAFVHELPETALGTASGRHDVVRVQVLTPAGALDQEQRQGITAELTELVAELTADPSQAGRTWVLFVEAPDGGWGIAGQALTLADIRQAAARALGRR